MYNLISGIRYNDWSIMARTRKVTDEQILASYGRTHSTRKTGEELGICAQSVHERLVKLGANRHVNVFTDDERQTLQECYKKYRDAGRLQELADRMGRTKQFICRQARRMGLTDVHRKMPYASVWPSKSDEEISSVLRAIEVSELGIIEFCTQNGIDDLGFCNEARRRFPAEYEAVAELKMGKSNSYRRGRDFEYYVKRKLEELGFIVFRSPVSKGPADLVAIRRGSVYFIQCKIGGYIGVKEWNKMLDFAEVGGAVPIMASRKKNGRGAEYFRMSAKKDGSGSRQPMEPFEFEPDV